MYVLYYICSFSRNLFLPTKAWIFYIELFFGSLNLGICINFEPWHLACFWVTFGPLFLLPIIIGVRLFPRTKLMSMYAFLVHIFVRKLSKQMSLICEKFSRTLLNTYLCKKFNLTPDICVKNSTAHEVCVLRIVYTQ